MTCNTELCHLTVETDWLKKNQNKVQNKQQFYSWFFIIFVLQITKKKNHIYRNVYHNLETPVVFSNDSFSSWWEQHICTNFSSFHCWMGRTLKISICRYHSNYFSKHMVMLYCCRKRNWKTIWRYQSGNQKLQNQKTDNTI